LARLRVIPLIRPTQGFYLVFPCPFPLWSVSRRWQTVGNQICTIETAHATAAPMMTLNEDRLRKHADCKLPHSPSCNGHADAWRPIWAGFDALLDTIPAKFYFQQKQETEGAGGQVCFSRPCSTATDSAFSQTLLSCRLCRNARRQPWRSKLPRICR
jgi:hypothetical protein